MPAIRFDSGLRKTVRNVLHIVIPVVSLIAAASCSLFPGTMSSSDNTLTASPIPEILIPVKRGTIASSLSFVGNLQYNQSATMTWKTDGVIEKVYVKVGDQVKKGEILAELAPDSLSSSVLIAEKDMIDQQQNLEDVKESESGRMQAYVELNAREKALQQAKLEQEALYYPRATREEMEIAWDKFALANLNFNYAKQDYDWLVSKNETWEGFEPAIYRNGRLVNGGDSRSGRERRFEDYVNTYNELVSAYENYVWTSGRPSDVEYAIAQGNVSVAQIEYDKALEEYLSYGQLPREKDVHAVEMSLNRAEVTYKTRFILAPFDGTVSSVNAVESYYVKQGDTALRVDDKSRIFVPLNVSELDISLLKEETPAVIVVDANYGKQYNGSVYSVSGSGTGSGSASLFQTMVEIDDPDDKLFAGMTAEVSLRVNEKKNVLLIPDSAVNYKDGNPYVMVDDGPERYELDISLGTVSGGIAEVTSDNLVEGDLLVVSSVDPEVFRTLGLNPSDYSPVEEQNVHEAASGQSGEGRDVSNRYGAGENRPGRNGAGQTTEPAPQPLTTPVSDKTKK